MDCVVYILNLSDIWGKPCHSSKPQFAWSYCLGCVQAKFVPIFNMSQWSVTRIPFHVFTLVNYQDTDGN